MAKVNDQRPTTNDDQRRRSQQGYILLMLMLFVTLLAIAAAAVAPSIAFRVRRDREEEMIHRGTQYSRAIRRYVKKTGRYPSRLEELENTNNVRFLRKRYKDPITGKDFKLLHVGEVQLTSAAGIAGAAAIGGGSIPGASPLGAATASASGPSASSGILLGGTPNSGASGRVGSGQPGSGTGAAGASDAADNSGEGAGQAGAGTPNQSSDQSADDSKTGLGAGSDKLSSAVFGGGPILGVASISKAQSIREFNHKNHYNQWQFIYDPTMDRGGLITTPAQPALTIAAPIQQQNSSSTGQNPASPGGIGGTGFSTGSQTPPPFQPTPQQ